MEEDDSENLVTARKRHRHNRLASDDEESIESEDSVANESFSGIKRQKKKREDHLEEERNCHQRYNKSKRIVKKKRNANKLLSKEEDCGSSIDENDVNTSFDKEEFRTPIKSQTSEVGKCTRSSSRLRKKQESKGTMKKPDRKEKLWQISCTPEETGTYKRRTLEPRKLVNNFFRERSTYNADRFETYLSEDDYEDDFVVDEQDSEDYETEESEDITPKKKTTKKVLKRQKKYKVSSSSSSGESSDDQPLMFVKQKRLAFNDSGTSTESSEIELNISNRKEKKDSLILRSDSEKDEKENVCHKSKVLPRRRNKEKEHIQKAACVLKRKRELAHSKLPLDRRRYLEREIEEEISSDIEWDDISIVGINDCMFSEDDTDEFTLRDSDKEFIALSSGSEDEKSHLRTEKEFKTCLENLRHSGGHYGAATVNEVDEKNSLSCKEDQLKYQRVILDYDSDDDMNNESLKDLYKNLRNRDCNINVIKRLIIENEGSIDSADSHGRRPLHVASIAGNVEAVKYLLEIGANANSIDRKCLPCIAYAAYWKHAQVLRLLLKKTNLASMHRLIHKHLNGMSLLHLILLDHELSESDDIETRQMECLKVVKECNSIMYTSLLDKADKKQQFPALIAISEGLTKCLGKLLENDQQLRDYRSEMSETVLHFAVINSMNCKEDDTAICLRILLARFKELINVTDKNGFTPLMYAAENGYVDCMKALIDFGAKIDLQDDHGTSALHLAAAIGSTDCVKLLLSHGHPVDILDDCGWPPLLYANFQSCESCVVELMRAQPKQLFVLSNLLKDCDAKQKEKNMQVIKSTILSLANQDAYYKIFNDFIRMNTELLDEFNYGIFSNTWTAILDFDNKQKWFRRRVSKQRKSYGSFVHLTVRRDRILESAMSLFEGSMSIDIDNLTVDFHNEPGICTGPKKEFLACLCNEIVQPEMKLFTQIDDQQYSPMPLSFFADITWSKCSFLNADSGVSPIKDMASKSYPAMKMEPVHRNIVTPGQMRCVKTELKEKLRAFTFLGKFIAACVADGWYINLQLSKPFIKQILGQKLNHPDDLQSVDHALYNGTIQMTKESVADLEYPFSIGCSNPWLESSVEEVLLSKSDSVLTDQNKSEFLNAVSKFKLCDSINREVKAFRRGFIGEVKQDLISVFTADEFSLLMSGVQNIDVEDWKNNTTYSGWSPNDPEVTWFWKTVKCLKQEEKALLLKFSTGSPCVPIGGFKELQGLGGKTLFSIARSHGNLQNSIPTAATCFNLIRLSKFTNEKELREKVLIALRHGSEGFAFG